MASATTKSFSNSFKDASKAIVDKITKPPVKGEDLGYLKKYYEGCDFKPFNIDTDSEEQNKLILESTLKLKQAELNKVIEEKKKLQKQADADISNTQNKINANVDESKKAQENELKYRILSCLLFSGIFDILGWVGNILENFELENVKIFADGVKKVIGDDKVLGFLGDANQFLKIDEGAKILAQHTPVVNEINQLFLSTAQSDLGSCFTGIAGDMLFTELDNGSHVASPFADFLLKSAILISRLNSEYQLMIDDQKRVEENDKQIEGLLPRIKEKGDFILKKFATSIIKIETEDALNKIDFKVLQDIRKDFAGTPSKIKEDLKNYKLFGEDGSEITADTLFDKIKCDDEKFTKIMKLQPEDKIKGLIEIVKDNSKELDGDVKTTYDALREKLLELHTKNLDPDSIKLEMNKLGHNMNSETDVEKIKPLICKLDRDDFDEAIRKLALHPTNVNARVAEMRAAGARKEGGMVKTPPPMDFVGGAPDGPTASATTPATLGPSSHPSSATAKAITVPPLHSSLP